MTKSKLKFKRVILCARPHRANQEIIETLQRLVDFLHSNQIETFLDIDTAQHFDVKQPTLDQHRMGKKGDLILVIGGDGSLLSAARMGSRVNVPVIGINRGRLGFLTDISPHDFEEPLHDILTGDYIEEQRFLLQMYIHNDTKTYATAEALNDVVLSRGNETHLIEFDVYVNQQFVSHYRADGLILSTPTGSTAYALSAGGPIMHPQLNAIVMVPMFSHSLSNRPLVFDGDASVEIHVSDVNENELQISCDGGDSHIVKPGQRVNIRKNPQRLRLLHPPKYHYYDTLRIKLGWGFKPLG